MYDGVCMKHSHEPGKNSKRILSTLLDALIPRGSAREARRLDRVPNS
jgi:hypothetical protein